MLLVASPFGECGVQIPGAQLVAKVDVELALELRRRIAEGCVFLSERGKLAQTHLVLHHPLAGRGWLGQVAGPAESVEGDLKV